MIKRSSHLAKKSCVPCRLGMPPMGNSSIKAYLQDLGNDWQVIKDHHLRKEYTFPDFKRALQFTTRVGELAEREGHHPTIELSYGKVIITTWTHKINGLSESDFILAAKCDEAT